MADVTAAISRNGFGLLRELAENNNREWYHAHKAAFEEQVLAPFASILELATERLAETPLPWQGGRDTMFRMNRDVRFSKDKSPYKTEVSGLLTPDGTKQHAGPIVYVACSDDGGMLAIGIYKPLSDTLDSIRTAIARDPSEPLRIQTRLTSRDRTIESSDVLKRIPRGYEDMKDHKVAELLRMKDMLVIDRPTKTDWQRGRIPERVERLATDSAELVAFLSSGASERSKT